MIQSALVKKQRWIIGVIERTHHHYDHYWDVFGLFRSFYRAADSHAFRARDV